MSLHPRWVHTRAPQRRTPPGSPHQSARGLQGSSSTPAALGLPTTSPGSASIPSFSLSLPGGSPAGPTGRWPPREEGFGVGLCHSGIIALLGHVTTTASQSPSQTPHSPTPCDPVPTPPAPCVRPRWAGTLPCGKRDGGPHMSPFRAADPIRFENSSSRGRAGPSCPCLWDPCLWTVHPSAQGPLSLVQT